VLVVEGAEGAQHAGGVDGLPVAFKRMGEAAVGVLEAVGSDRSVERPVGVGAAAARSDSERWTGGEGLELLVAVVLVAVDPDHPAFLDGRAWARSGPAVDERAAGAGGGADVYVVAGSQCLGADRGGVEVADGKVF